MVIDAAATDRHRAGPSVRDPVREDPAEVVRRLLSGAQPSATLPPAGIAGIEQEYEVRVDGRRVDFGQLIERVAPAGASRRFAFDAQARIVRSGAVWTVDAPHAEVATPPRQLGMGIASRLADDVLTERDALRRRLLNAVPGRAELRGYSTHLNAYADDVDGWMLVRHVALAYAPALMLMAERPSSPGLLVRPRPQRLEIGTEYLESREDLVAAAVVVLATAVAAWRECRGDETAPLPLLDGGRLQSTWQRPGWFVPRDAFGEDLYRSGRTARLRVADGSLVSAGDRLAQTWEHLRPVATAFAADDELALVDDLVAGRALLPLERGLPSDPLVRPVPRRRPASAPVFPVAPAQSSLALQSRRHGRLRLSPEAITWDQALLRVSHPARTFYLAVPREAAPQFEAAWASGALDAPLATYAASAPADRMAVLDQARAGVFDTVEPPHLAAARLQSAKPHGPRPKPRPPLALPAVPVAPVASGLPLPLPAQPVVPPPAFLQPPIEQPPTSIPPPTVQRTPGQPPIVGRPMLPQPTRPPWRGVPGLIGIVVLVLVVVVGLVGVPALTRQTGSVATPTPSASRCLPGEVCDTPSVSPSASGCIPGIVCGSPSPAMSPTPTASQCLPGTVCGSPSPSPSPSPTPMPTPQPTPTPTPHPTPDRTGPRITGLAWTPDPVGFIAATVCTNQTKPSTTIVTVTVTVTDPSGVKSVTLVYRRVNDSAVQSIGMIHVSGGTYHVVFDTKNDANWNPPNLTYVTQLGVHATDKAGNTSILGLRPGFTVETCY